MIAVHSATTWSISNVVSNDLSSSTSRDQKQMIRLTIIFQAWSNASMSQDWQINGSSTRVLLITWHHLNTNWVRWCKFKTLPKSTCLMVIQQRSLVWGKKFVAPGLTLKHVLCVPNFQHNLLSVQKLIKDGNCVRWKFPLWDNLQCHGKGERNWQAKNGMYYYLHTNQKHKKKSSLVSQKLTESQGNSLTSPKTKPDLFASLHHRLASLSKLEP